MARAPQDKATDTSTAGEGSRADDLRDAVGELRRDIDKILDTLAALGHEQKESLKDRLAAQAGRLHDLGSEKLAGAEARAADVITDIEDYARRRPTRALAVAAGFGMLIGLLFGRGR